MKTLPAPALLIIGIMSVASGFVDLRTRAYPVRPYTEFIPGVVNGSADAPERYRVLVPFTAAALTRMTGLSPSAIWHTSRLALFFVAYIVFFCYLRTWFSPSRSLLGTAVVAATLPLTFTNSWAHPDHIAELALFTGGCLAIARQQFGWTALLVAVATLNRETAVFLVLLHLAAGPLTRARLLRTMLLGVEWAAIYLALRIWRGIAHYDYLQIWRNLEFLRLLPSNYDPYYRAYAYFVFVLFGGLLAVALLTRTRPPGAFADRALWIVPPFAAVAFTMSSIIETRIFTPLYPLVMPAVIFACGTADTADSPADPLKRHA
jgi:hypothetical protein